MKIRNLLLLLIGVSFLPACGGNVQLTVFPDGSGQATIIRPDMKYPEKSDLDSSNFKGMTSYQNYKAQFQTDKFDMEEVSKAELGGITFDFKDQGETVMIKMNVPIGPDQPWFKQLNVDQKSLDNMLKFKDRFLSTASDQVEMLTMGLGLDNPFVTLQINAPGHIVSKNVSQPDWQSDFAISELIGGGSGAENKAYLQIPISEVKSKKVENLTVKIEARKKPVSSIKKKWDKKKSR